MSSVICNFCSRGNPEGSKFCNECGSPLSLTLCSRCEAINNVSATQCHQCGAPLSPAAPEQNAIPPTALTGMVQSAEGAPTKDDPVPIALEERLDALLAAARVASHEPQATTAEERPLAAASPTADPFSHTDDGPLLHQAHGDHATYSARSPARAHGFLLVVVLVALAGAVYW